MVGRSWALRHPPLPTVGNGNRTSAASMVKVRMVGSLCVWVVYNPNGNHFVLTKVTRSCVSIIRGKTTDIGTIRKGLSPCIYPMVGLEKGLGGYRGMNELSATGDLVGTSRSFSHSLAYVPGAVLNGEGMLGGVAVYHYDCMGCMMHKSWKKRERLEPR